MLISALLLFSSSMLNVKPSPVFAGVSIGNLGPYRFLVDTGSQTTLIDARLAARLDLKPTFRVQVITQNSTRLLPGALASTLRVGQVRLPESEVVFQDLAEARRLDSSIQGVLGWNALAGLNFSLDSRAGKLDLAAARPPGEPVAFQRVEDRIAVAARMGRETLRLILDSGATHIVLFRTPEAMARTRPIPATFATLDAARSVLPTCWTADMFFTRALRVGTLPAAIVARPGAQVDGLLPASVFDTIYVDQGRGELVLVR